MAGVFLLKKQSRTGNRLIAAVLAIIAFQHFMHYIWATRLSYTYPWLLNIDLALDGLIAPLLYFYIRIMAGEKIKWRPVHLLHLWPLVPGIIWYVIFNLQPQAKQYDFIDHVYSDVPMAAAIINLQLVIYLGLGYRILNRHMQAQATTQWASGYSNLEWLKQLVIILFLLNLGMVPGNMVAKFSYIMVGFPALTSFVLLFVFYKSVTHPEVMSSELIRKFTQQLEYQRELEKVRSQISRDIHDELGAGLTRISMMGEIARMQQTQNTDVGTKLNDIVDVSHQLMGNLKEVVWAINPEHDNLDSLLAFFRYYLSNFYEPTDIKLRIDFTDRYENIPLPPALRRNLILVVKEAANNMVKHANATEATFKIWTDTHALHLLITDNGNGQPAQANHTGNGLKSMQKRIQETGGEITITHTPGSGYSIAVVCPIKPNV
jgi:signal transduction histidine kinase